ncbi:MAG: N-6 DNA methylase [Chloroflexota bacterium]|nr:N-6 DNA methylase [Chloroflexota bacterium]
MLERCRLRAILRLPPGIFYAQGVKANVIYFEQAHDRSTASGTFAMYDLRTDMRVSLKTKPLQRRDLTDFVTRYRESFAEDPQENRRVRLFSVKDVLGTGDCQLDIAWCDDAGEPRDPRLVRLERISKMVADDLTRALALIRDLQGSSH